MAQRGRYGGRPFVLLEGWNMKQASTISRRCSEPTPGRSSCSRALFSIVLTCLHFPCCGIRVTVERSRFDAMYANAHACQDTQVLAQWKGVMWAANRAFVYTGKNPSEQSVPRRETVIFFHAKDFKRMSHHRPPHRSYSPLSYFSVAVHSVNTGPDCWVGVLGREVVAIRCG